MKTDTKNFFVGLIAVILFVAFINLGGDDDAPKSPPRTETKTEQPAKPKPQPVVKTPEVPKTPEVTNSTVVEEATFVLEFSNYQQTVNDNLLVIADLMETYSYKRNDQNWVTKMALALYMLEDSAKNIENLTVPAYFQTRHDQYLREGISPLKSFVKNVMYAMDNNDVNKLNESMSDMETYHASFMEYTDFVVKRMSENK